MRRWMLGVWTGVKSLAGGMLCAMLCATPVAHAAPGVVQSGDAFRKAIDIVLQRMAKSYRDGQAGGMQVLLMDAYTTLDAVYFQRGTHPQHDSIASLLSATYRPSMQINGQSTPVCLVRYNASLRRRQTDGYEQLGLLSRRDILYYLAAHEFGHCMDFDQTARGGVKQSGLKASPELIADRVAATFFVVNHQPDVAWRLVQVNREVKDVEHRHPQELSGYIADLVRQSKDDATLGVRSMFDVYQRAISVTR